ncbi:MAG: glycosyltransferase family 4 protein [Deltaproteobacteria bacterium]
MKSVKRVLFINHSIRDGGPGKSLFYILKFLDRKRISPYVLIPKDDVFSERLKAEGIYENVITDKRFPENLKRPRFERDTGKIKSGGLGRFYTILLHLLSVFLNILDLASLVITSPFLIKGKKIDVIYCNGTQAKIAGALMGLANWCPVIWHVRNIQQTKLLGSMVYTLAALPVVKRIVCVSGATAEQFPYARGKLVVIHNGIDPEDYNPETTVGEIRRDYELSDKTIVIGSTGRIVPRKGYDLFIKSAGQAIKRSENKNVKFVIVGDTPFFFSDNHLVYLKNLVSELGLEEYFIFTGFRKDVRPCLKDFDIFVIPSSYPDPFPRSVIEAMSFALPVIGFRAGGIVESVEDGVTGILSEPDSTEEMENAILRLIANKGLRREMGKAGRERVKQNFSADRIAERIQEQILQVTGKP